MRLDVKDLYVSYGAIAALKGVTLTIEASQIVTLIGANGAGKTTLVRAISRLLPAIGSIQFGNCELLSLLPHQVVEKGLIQVPEGRMIFHNLNVYENLKLGFYKRTDKQNFENDLEEVLTLFPKLKGRLKQLGGFLSGGEQQMLAIGRALMGAPQILLLDEPSLGLAPNLVQQIFEALKKIHQQKKISIFLIEQDAKAALKMASYAYVMETGKIVLEGRASDLLQNPEVQKVYLGMN